MYNLTLILLTVRQKTREPQRYRRRFLTQTADYKYFILFLISAQIRPPAGNNPATSVLSLPLGYLKREPHFCMFICLSLPHFFNKFQNLKIIS